MDSLNSLRNNLSLEKLNSRSEIEALCKDGKLIHLFLAKCPKDLKEIHHELLLERLVKDVSRIGVIVIDGGVDSIESTVFTDRGSLFEKSHFDLLNQFLKKIDGKISLVLKKLNLSDLQVSDLCKLDFKKIRSLDLTNNSITDKGLQKLYLTVLCNKNSQLDSLILDKTLITDEGALKLQGWLKSEDQPRYLSICQIPLSVKTIKLLKEVAYQSGFSILNCNS